MAVAEEEIEPLQGELNAILAFVEQLSQVDVEGVEPMTSVIPMAMKKREDKVTDGAIADDIVRNAPAMEDHFFVVPKVVESAAPRLIARASLAIGNCPCVSPLNSRAISSASGTRISLRAV